MENNQDFIKKMQLQYKDDLIDTYLELETYKRKNTCTCRTNTKRSIFDVVCTCGYEQRVAMLEAEIQTQLKGFVNYHTNDNGDII